MSEAERRAAERDLFVRRAALPAPPPPSFTAVLARARRDDPVRRPRRVRLWSFLAAAAALVVGVELTGRDAAPAPEEATAIVAEPAPAAERCEDPSAIAKAAATREEHAYAACLSGTPSCAAMAQEPHEAERDEEPTCSVTCDACGPHPGEVLDPGTQGECAP